GARPAPAPGPTSGGGAGAVATARLSSTSGGITMRLVEPLQATSQPMPEPQPAPEIEPEPVADEVPLRSLADIAALASENRDMQFKVLLRRYVRPVRIEPGRI